MSLSLQHVCLACADREIPKLIQNLQQDLRKIKEELDRLGVNHVSLFPDLDGLSRHLNWQFGIF